MIFNDINAQKLKVKGRAVVLPYQPISVSVQPDSTIKPKNTPFLIYFP